MLDMWILPLIGYLGVIVGFTFLTLAIASGLYYLSELVEEHTVLARRLLSRLIYAIISIHIVLCLVDRLPFSLSLLSIISHLVYASNLRRFPFVKLTDPLFILSCLLVGLNHWVWFRHFSNPVALQAEPHSFQGSRGQRYYDAADLPTFTEIASYFGLCVWLVPFALFVSLSAGENVLPTIGSEYAMGMPRGSSVSVTSGAGGVMGGVVVDLKNKNKGMAKALVDGVRDWVGETGELLGFWRGERTRPF